MATEHGKGQLSENSSETSHPSYARGINASSDENCQCEKSFSDEKHLQEINRKVVVSVGDGNCLFRSISTGLLGTESYHALARKAVTDTMVNNPKIFNQLCTVIHGESLQQRCQRMSQQGIWASTVELIATATAFQVPVYVFCQPHIPVNNEWKWLKYSPRATCNVNTNPDFYQLVNAAKAIKPEYGIELSYHNQSHFNCVLPLDASSPLPLPQLSSSTWDPTIY